MSGSQGPGGFNGDHFEPPPAGATRAVQQDGSEEAAAATFSSPETGSGGTEEVVAPEARGMSLGDDRLLSIKQAIEEQLLHRAQTAGVLAEDVHEGAGNIVGVAIG